MNIGLIARGHNSGGLSDLLETGTEDEAPAEVEEFRQREIQSNVENQIQTKITPDPKKQKFKRNCHVIIMIIPDPT